MSKLVRSTAIWILALIVALWVLSTAADASHVRFNTRQKNTRNQAAALIGQEAHFIVESYLTEVLSGWVPGPVTKVANEVFIEQYLPQAPPRPRLYGGESGTGGYADLVALFSDEFRCSVFEIKPIAQRMAGVSWLAQRQLASYVEGIDRHPTLPCFGRRGTEWVGASWPNSLTVPQKGYPHLWRMGIELQITQTCDLDVSECGIIWYWFRWQPGKDGELERSVPVRSGTIAEVIISLSTRKLQNVQDVDSSVRLAAQVERLLIGKDEISDTADIDAWQQMIDIVRPNGEIDPWVTNVAVMANIDFLMELQRLKSRPFRFLPPLPAGNTRCPYKGTDARDLMCAA